ncbi:hypothetical protein Nizo2726_0208 [Lactiplantibacillus plantarum]|uniref:Uncharacterized protein n=2 Tax=Lactiplantibacillus plantarum TaxID=1590 RepID=A0A162GJ10_LACPN|nr:hypothetical protein LPST_C2462 [Lactiplantibacillus plantarum ST-III]AHN70103.1 hypothetical protein I526_2418 [Lactiplantibacillus plantarum DOMLa]ALC09774.1 hypothetical protein JM48_2569 [Lactiplantibacillus plantarum]EFK28943.1 hypothetical protein HMPREF0531_12062 [Lactiplantibacillus plantarum subsp. plantarum ATCC 14917 = JCM 1149 = CGMCC 1.2437]ERO40081.1 hypothetical protein LPLWJ_28360 [Lactiplantibacillus plantarum WJL]
MDGVIKCCDHYLAAIESRSTIILAPMIMMSYRLRQAVFNS